MMTHLPFTVERWDVRAWITVPEPDNSAWPSIGIDMPPGARTKTQHWPFDAMDDPVPGRYRVVKTAVYEEPEHGSSRELTATATFKVMK